MNLISLMFNRITKYSGSLAKFTWFFHFACDPIKFTLQETSEKKNEIHSLSVTIVRLVGECFIKESHLLWNCISLSEAVAVIS